MKIISKAIDLVRTLHRHNTLPLHLEFVLSDACNLNCKGCTHFSPVASDDRADLPQIEANLKHLASVLRQDDIPEWYLIGGEPLILPLPLLIGSAELIRKYFPHNRILIFTNGLMIPKMPEEFWEACRRIGIIIALTRYPIKVDYDAIEERVRREGVECSVFGDRGENDSFFRFPLDPAGRQNKRLAHLRCFNFGCLSIVGDRLYPCSTAACSRHLNQRFGTDFQILEGDSIRISDIRSARDIRRLRNRPVPFCRYCRHHEDATYAPSRREASEWIDSPSD